MTRSSSPPDFNLWFWTSPSSQNYLRMFSWQRWRTGVKICLRMYLCRNVAIEERPQNDTLKIFIPVVMSALQYKPYMNKWKQVYSININHFCIKINKYHEFSDKGAGRGSKDMGVPLLERGHSQLTALGFLQNENRTIFTETWPNFFFFCNFCWSRDPSETRGRLYCLAFFSFWEILACAFISLYLYIIVKLKRYWNICVCIYYSITSDY